MTDLAIDDPISARAALSDHTLVTPPAPASLGVGSTATLRAAMARFSDGVTHARPRADVERAISRISASDLTEIAARRTEPYVRGSFDARTLAFIVPTETIALGLGLDEAHLGSIVADVEHMARSIGRGEDATSETDAAVDRLASQLADHPDGDVAAVSLLYQVFDSTAALFSVALISERTAQPRRSALAKTVRRSTVDVTIGDQDIQAETTVLVSLEGDGMEFGAGRHQCPGEALARAIVDGMLVGLDRAELLIDDITATADGRPTALPMRKR